MIIQVSGHPWWPGIVANESTNFLSYSKKCTNYEKFFISFYGNKSTNAWISEKMLEKYKGKNAFENSSQSLCMNVENKAQRAQLAKKYELKVPHSRYQEWEHAIAQADKANHMNRKKRFEHLNFDLFSYCKNKFATQSIEAEIAVIDKQSLDVRIITIIPGVCRHVNFGHRTYQPVENLEKIISKKK